MIRRLAELPEEQRMDIRGGRGPARGVDLLREGDMEGLLGLGRTTLDPGSTIGEHVHPDTHELYLVLEGHGTGILDGRRFPVGPGDSFLVKAGGSHGLDNDSEAPLAFLGLLTRASGRP